MRDNMSFKNKLNHYLNDLNCSSKELSTKSLISESVISRYRNGERTPKENSEQLKKISNAIEKIITEKKITKYQNTNIYNELVKEIKKNNDFHYQNFSHNLNNLISVLKINTNEMAKFIGFDSSHISRIRYGKAKPSDPISFAKKIATFINSKYNNEETVKKIQILTQNNTPNKELDKLIFNYLTNNPTKETTNYLNNFLNNLDNFNLNDYIKAINFNKLKIPNIPFYKARKKNYYGLNEMKQGELDFFKGTIFSKTKQDIFMYSNMPMEDMAQDLEFGKKWMFSIAACLKKGLHLNIIHNLNRPFNEMMLGLESWIPIYMTGQISPFYLKDNSPQLYQHLIYVSEYYALTGECLNHHHDKGKYYLTNNTKELNYYQEQSNLILKKANPLMEIYTEEKKELFQIFLLNDSKIKTNRKRILNSLPLFTITDKLLEKILIRNKLSPNEIQLIKNYKKKEYTRITKILDNSKITDIIYNPTEEDNYLALENIFTNKKINYTLSEYNEHLNTTQKFNHKNYQIQFNSNKVFKNISITILKNNYAIISKNSNPVIHFIIKQPNLLAAIENFDPLIK